MRPIRLLRRAAFVAACLSAPAVGRAQSLGPQRQFLAVEPYYEYTRLDDGGGSGSAPHLNGYGARLWINGAPFHFPLNSAIALFTTYAPSTSDFGAAALHYGGQIDQFFVRRPFGGFFDPFVSVSAGGYRIHAKDEFGGGSTTHFALAPGGGVRIPIPNRLEIRGDVRDLLLFNNASIASGSSKTTNNLLVQAGLGITF